MWKNRFIRKIEIAAGDVKSIVDAYNKLIKELPGQMDQTKIVVDQEHYEEALKQFLDLPASTSKP